MFKSLSSNPHLHLRAIEPHDLDLLYLWENHPQMRKSNNLHRPVSKQQLRFFISQNRGSLDPRETGFLHLMIEDLQEQETVGIISLYNLDNYHKHGAIGIAIHPQKQQRGYATRALEMFVPYLQGHWQLHLLYAEIAEHNEAAKRLFFKAGFSQTATLPEWLWDGSQYNSLLIYSLTTNK